MNEGQPLKNPTMSMDLIFSILQIICCCFTTGVISLLLVIIGNNDFKCGDIVGYNYNTKRAKTARIIGYVLFGVKILIALIVYVVLVVLSASTYM